jgi:nucleoside-diphosphate-sugar epimerase
MRIAVTGGTGFIGRYILRRLALEGHELRAWHRHSSDRSGLDDVAGQTTWVEGTLGNQDDARDLVKGCDAVVHGALYHPGGGFRGGEGDLIAFCQTNIIGSLQLIDAARRAGVKRLVFISSCAVHEKILGDRPLDETHPTWAASAYGAQKAAIEQFVYSFGLGEEYPICALRPTGVYGTDHPAEQSKWFDLVGRVVRGETVNCQSGGKEVHAADVAKAASLLLGADAAAIRGQAFNCYDRYVSLFEVASIAKRLSGSSAEICGRQTAPKNQIETGKLRALAMQFGGITRLESAIEELVHAHRAT